MRTHILSLVALASAVAAQSSTVETAPVVSHNPQGASFVAQFPEQTKYAVRGSVAGASALDGTGVTFAISVSGLPADGGPFMYHIHEKPVPSDGNCSGTGAHLDPYKRGQLTLCDAGEPDSCEVGDLSGKHGNITAENWSTEYTDIYVSTRPDSKAYFGNLSVVIHLSDKTRIACANFTQISAGDHPVAPSGVSSGCALPTASGGYSNSTASSKPTGSASPTTGVPVSPSSTSSSAPPEFTAAAPKLITGAATAVVAIAAALLL
ncbi:hypothetical protein E8E13_004807 [Curvularia kusanoi]|uniref:superoxide dismutase n=1 Tax=Curvularia kusanoi TaxID=90978 RepID=A0A9P4TBP2_CURKU|nr:hypothetical protein E8E13_004807 [Curvularia kusanoi]